MMIENLETTLAYIASIQDFCMKVSPQSGDWNGRYKLAEQFKRFVLEEVLLDYVKSSAMALRSLPMNSPAVSEQRERWRTLCDDYRTYVDTNEIIDCYDKIIQNG